MDWNSKRNWRISQKQLGLNQEKHLSFIFILFTKRKYSGKNKLEEFEIYAKFKDSFE